MEYINPMIQVEWTVIRLMEHRVVTRHSVRLGRIMAFDVEHITCGTSSSPFESVASPTFAFIDSVVHASCDPAFIGGVVHLSSCHSLPHRLSVFMGGVVWESGDAVHSFMPLPKERRSFPDLSKDQRVVELQVAAQENTSHR